MAPSVLMMVVVFILVRCLDSCCCCSTSCSSRDPELTRTCAVAKTYATTKKSIIIRKHLKIWRNGEDMDSYVGSSIPDLWCFYTNPHSRIRTTGLRFWIRILLFSSMAFRMLTKYKFFRLFLTVDTFTSVFKENKLLRNKKKWRRQGLLTFLRYFAWKWWKWEVPDHVQMITVRIPYLRFLWILIADRWPLSFSYVHEKILKREKKMISSVPVVVLPHNQIAAGHCGYRPTFLHRSKYVDVDQ